MDWTEPRSTSSHCGSENALDHRVLRFPSTAFEGGYEALCSEDAVAGWFSAMLVVPQLLLPVPKTWNSHSEYPYPAPRTVPYMRLYRPRQVPRPGRRPASPPPPEEGSACCPQDMTRQAGGIGRIHGVSPLG